MFRVFILFVYFTQRTSQGCLGFGNNESQIIPRFKRQSENLCALPNHPPNGEIKILLQKDSYLPGSKVGIRTIIDLSCTNGTVTETLGLSRAICNQGQWNPPVSRMKCIRKCPQVQTEREDLFVICTHKNPKVNCSNPIEGTIIQLACKPFYQSVGQPIITCRNGTWDGVISPCQSECGKKRVITGAELEYPWVAGIYDLTNDTKLHGGATIISRQTLLSAAFLFTAKKGVRLDINNYIVTAGKYYREFGDQRDTNVQISRIKRLYIPENYGGPFHHNDLGNFAVLTLEYPFLFTEHVQPVCVDWTNQFESSDLKEDNKGVIAGWGYTQSGNRYGSEELHKLAVPYKSKDTCSMTESAKGMFFTDDKFCAGFDDTNNTCDVGLSGDLIYYDLAGDAGSGLFFQNSDTRFYIRGILSMISTKSWRCSTRGPALYTKLSTYMPELVKETGRTP